MVRTIFISTLLLISSVTSVQANQPSHNTKFMATLNGGPVMQSVQWAVRKDGTTVAKENRHAFATYLPPATYHADVTCPSGVVRSRDFTTANALSVEVIIACD